MNDLNGSKAYQITKCLQVSWIKPRWPMIVIRSCNKVLQQVFFHFDPWSNNSLACSQQFLFSPLPKAYQILKCVSNSSILIVQRKQACLLMDMILWNELLLVQYVLSLRWFKRNYVAWDLIEKSKYKSNHDK